jgi:hypothetical protein
MDNISKILFDRLVKKEKKFQFYKEKYKLDRSQFDNKLKSITNCKEIYADELIVRAYKLFESKVNNEKEIYKWNNENPNKKQKPYVFSNYCKIDDKGFSVKDEEKFSVFFKALKRQYESQTKHQLVSELNWISDFPKIGIDDHVCYYCGISENVLKTLFNDADYTCKTKRNRGAWFELDRKNANNNFNVYNESNIVLCCYFCNNHKSDVISSDDMRLYFGEKMFNYLILQYNKLSKNK